ncbi:Gar/GrdA family gentamicin resistance ATP-binding protein [Pseudomonas borbori]
MSHELPASQPTAMPPRASVIVLNGPLGIGKSTLAEVLMEALDQSVMLDGDQVVAVNPAPDDELEYLHSTLALLIGHHWERGYRHFIVNHIWHSADELDDLRRRLGSFAVDVHCFLLVLPVEENLQRIRLRQSARAIDELEFEMETVERERAILGDGDDSGLGEPFDVSAAPNELVLAMLTRLALR